MSQKTKIILTHNCGIPGAEGMPGDEIEVDAKLAEKLLSRGGAKRPGDKKKSRETATNAPSAEHAELITAQGETLNALSETVTAQGELLDALSSDVAAIRQQLAGEPDKEPEKETGKKKS